VKELCEEVVGFLNACVNELTGFSVLLKLDEFGAHALTELFQVVKVVPLEK
jgi:hypothetical protein